MPQTINESELAMQKLCRKLAKRIVKAGRELDPMVAAPTTLELVDVYSALLRLGEGEARSNGHVDEPVQVELPDKPPSTEAKASKTVLHPRFIVEASQLVSPKTIEEWRKVLNPAEMVKLGQVLQKPWNQGGDPARNLRIPPAMATRLEKLTGIEVKVRFSGANGGYVDVAGASNQRLR